MFKVNKNTRTCFTPYFSISVLDFEQVNVSWATEKTKRQRMSFSGISIVEFERIPEMYLGPCLTSMIDFCEENS